MTTNRRNLRSEHPGQALTFMLHACRERANLEAVVIADDAGLLVAHAGSLNVDVEEIAAVLPEPAHRRRVAGLRATRFDVDGQIVYFGTIGGDAQSSRVVDDAMQSAKRILGAA